MNNINTVEKKRYIHSFKSYCHEEAIPNEQLVSTRVLLQATSTFRGHFYA